MKQRLFRPALATSLALALTGLLLWTAAIEPARADSDVHCVNQSGTGCDAVCGGRCYGSVQPAIDAAGGGHQIRIADGIYTDPVGTVAAITKELSIRGGFGQSCSDHDPDHYRTTLDAQWGGSVISITNAGDVLMEFLTLTHGDGTGNCGPREDCAGGVYVKDTAVHIGHCMIMDNVGSRTKSAFGGGIYVDNRNNNQPAEIWGNQIVSNTASTADTGWGGGLYLKSASYIASSVVSENQFEDNTASSGGWGQGGGVYVQRYAILNNNLFRHNRASTAAAGLGQGGGVYLWEVWDATLEANRFIGNTASALGNGYGGAIFGRANVVFTMTNNLLAENNASSMGGGLWLGTWSGNYITGTLVNNTLVGNDAGGGGEGVWVDAYVSLEMINNIIAGHRVGVTNTQPASSTVTADHNLFWNTSDPVVGTDGIREDPLLGSDYHQLEGSPVINGGLTIPWLTVDLEGSPRPQDGAYDLGAYEGIWWEVFLPVVVRE